MVDGLSIALAIIAVIIAVVALILVFIVSPSGTPGPNGAPGPTGITGATGTIGGATGPTGPRGATSGEAGGTGPTGLMGPAGLVGPAGVMGPTGTTGQGGGTGSPGYFLGFANGLGGNLSISNATPVSIAHTNNQFVYITKPNPNQLTQVALNPATFTTTPECVTGSQLHISTQMLPTATKLCTQCTNGTVSCVTSGTCAAGSNPLYYKADASGSLKGIYDDLSPGYYYIYTFNQDTQGRCIANRMDAKAFSDQS